MTINITQWNFHGSFKTILLQQQIQCIHVQFYPNNHTIVTMAMCIFSFHCMGNQSHVYMGYWCMFVLRDSFVQSKPATHQEGHPLKIPDRPFFLPRRLKLKTSVKLPILWQNVNTGHSVPIPDSMKPAHTQYIVCLTTNSKNVRSPQNATAHIHVQHDWAIPRTHKNGRLE